MTTMHPGTAQATAVTGNWIGGAWSTSGTVTGSTSPSTGAVLGIYVSAGAAEAQQAIDAARTAFDTTDWSRDPSRRYRAILELADRLEARTQEIAASLSSEGGKLLGEVMWEVGTTPAWLRYSAATAITQGYGRAAETAPGVYFQSVPEAAGVVGVITPWNSPIILTARSIGPALAAGCTVVVKMPGQTGLTNAMLAEVIASTPSLPPGVVNIFSEAGNTGAPLLVESPDVDVVSYTGSTHVGRAIAAAGAKTLKRLNLELGGKTPLVIFDDADLDAVLPQVIRALVMMNGQFCVTGSRLLVQQSIADEFRERLIAAVQSVRLGPSDDPGSQLGPLIDKASVGRVDELVRQAASYGKVLVEGGPVTEGPLKAGAFYRPSIIEVQDLDAPLIQQEVFGPVQTFEVFTDDADAIRRVNATEFGLAAAVFTRDEARARKAGREIRAGLVWTNCWALLSEQFEEGGYKQSGYGYLCGPRAIEQFQNLKVYSQMAPPTT